MNHASFKNMTLDSVLTSSAPRSFSVTQVAEFLHCEVQAVEIKLKLGTLPGIQFGKEWIIPEQIFVSYFNALAMSQTQERLMVQQSDSTDPINSIAPPPKLGKTNAIYSVRKLISEEEMIQLSSIVHKDDAVELGKSFIRGNAA